MTLFVCCLIVSTVLAMVLVDAYQEHRSWPRRSKRPRVSYTKIAQLEHELFGDPLPLGVKEFSGRPGEAIYYDPRKGVPQIIEGHGVIGPTSIPR